MNKRIINEILPEAIPIPGTFGKWLYKGWVICPGCGFVDNRELQKKLFFKKNNAEDLKNILSQIK